MAAALVACAPAANVPTPRPIVIFSGARLSASPERMEVVDVWVREEMANIQEDPTFLVATDYRAEIVYPWEGLRIKTCGT